MVFYLLTLFFPPNPVHSGSFGSSPVNDSAESVDTLGGDSKFSNCYKKKKKKIQI